MKTTEIFVEQVLIGLLVLTTGFLPYIGLDDAKKIFSNIGKGAGIVALAYLLGIVFDRFADTLLSRLEQYYRAKFANDKANRKYRDKTNRKKDPYPEQYIQVQILNKSDSAIDRMDYLRSRIRLSRSLAVFIPALTISGLLKLGSEHCDFPGLLKPVIMGVMTLIYFLSFFSIVLIDFKNKDSKWESWEVPKTYDSDLERKVNEINLWWEPTTIAALLIVIMAVGVAVWFMLEEYSTFIRTSAILLTGLGISALSAWTWWRISKTFMQFLMDWNTNEREMKD